MSSERNARLSAIYTRHHATIFLPDDIAAPVEALRRRWDPAMAAQIAAHITLVYPQEAPDAALLRERLATVCHATAPFRLRLAGVAVFGRAEEGVYVDVQDTQGAFARMHAALVTPPMEPIVFPPHVTLVHPRTSHLGVACWRAQQQCTFDATFEVRAATITGWDGTRWATLERFAFDRNIGD